MFAVRSHTGDHRTAALARGARPRLYHIHQSLVVCATDRPRVTDRPESPEPEPEPQIKGKRSAVRTGRTRCCSAELRSTAALQSRQLLQDGPSSSSSAAAAGERGALGIVLSDAPSATEVGERRHVKGELHLQALVVADAREVGVDVTEVVPRRLCGAGARCSTGGGQRGSTDTRGGRGGDAGGGGAQEDTCVRHCETEREECGVRGMA